MHLELVDQRTRVIPPPLTVVELSRLVSDLGHGDWCLNLVLVDDPQMADLNQRWYGGQGPTDVLSFSYLEPAGVGEAALAAGVGRAAHDLWTDPGDGDATVIAGEVIIAPDFVAGRCVREGWNLADEWALLLVHGALHVLGWTHGDEAGQAAMREQEAAVLLAAGRPHPLLPGGGGES